LAPGSRNLPTEFLIRACGILTHGDAVLMQEAPDGRGDRGYALPGGHLEFGESLAACLAREFYEEGRLSVEADKLVYVHENFYRYEDRDVHEIGFYFTCDLSGGFPTADADGFIPAYEDSIRLRLLPLADLRSHPVLPRFLVDRLPRDARDAFARPVLHLTTRGE
jgi:8-oxo-dGTP pyrophosphatase MutT (NUDIX family)